MSRGGWNGNDTSILILTHIDKASNSIKLPHIDWIEKTNPGTNVNVIVGEDSELGVVDNWRNGDRPLRKWWIENSHTIKTPIVHVIEWDTLVGGPLPELPSHLDLAGRELMLPGMPWQWWADVPSLNLNEDESPVGLVSFGAFVMRREVLDAVCDPRWDEAYENSIQNELRFPTIASVSGFNVGEAHLPFIRYHYYPIAENPLAGIYHGVKTPYTGTFITN